MARETTGERIQRLRKAAGLSQSGLAKATGIPVSTIKNWEQGRRSPLLDTAGRVAGALNVSLDELTGDGGQAPPKTAASAAKPKRKRGK
jgi:transcriptional regulator with XRE-family HTH domain